MKQKKFAESTLLTKINIIAVHNTINKLKMIKEIVDTLE